MAVSLMKPIAGVVCAESVSGLDQLEQVSQKPNCVESDCHQDGKHDVKNIGMLLILGVMSYPFL